LYNLITPLLEPDTEATPLVNVMAVGEPNVTGAPELSATVGWCSPIVLAPPNDRLLEPLYAVTVLLPASLAITVRLSPAPAVGVVLAASRTRWVALPEARTTDFATLRALHERQTAVTVYSYLPAASPVSVQLVWEVGEAELGHPLLGAPPSRLT
jgi:hypothetical protein